MQAVCRLESKALGAFSLPFTFFFNFIFNRHNVVFHFPPKLEVTVLLEIPSSAPINRVWPAPFPGRVPVLEESLLTAALGFLEELGQNPGACLSMSFDSLQWCLAVQSMLSASLGCTLCIFRNVFIPVSIEHREVGGCCFWFKTRHCPSAAFLFPQLSKGSII